MKKYFKLFRVKHYVKNGLIFLPLIFAGSFSDSNLLLSTYGFISFSLMASFVYIINDLFDIEKDRQHPVKKNRPIASGEISVKKAVVLGAILFVISSIFVFFSSKNSFQPVYLLYLYLVINIIYSFGAKNIVLVDILFLVIGFILRIYFGASIIGIKVSNWLYLTIMSSAFFFSFGKRRNEAVKSTEKTRKVLSFYTKDFLDKNMYMSLTLSIVFYSLWAIEQNIQYLVLSIPIVILIFMRYTMIIEGDSHGDPTDVLLGDKILLILSMVFVFGMLYLFWRI